MSERTFDWNDTIQNDSEFQVLPEGDYDFTVKAFERGRHDGSDKLPPCNMAVLDIEVTNGTRSSTLTHRLFLHSKTEGFLCAFFSAIGQRRSGEALRMDWAKVTGAKGRCKVGIRKWTGKDGQEMESNQISKFYPYDGVPKAYTPGEF